MNAAFLLISTAWLAGTDVTPCACQTAAPTYAASCGCDCGCTCRPPGLLRRIMMAIPRPDCCGACGCCPCGCTCQPPGLLQRILRALPRPDCCCNNGCGDFGHGAAFGGHDHAVPAAPGAEQIAPPKEMPKGETPMKIGAVTPLNTTPVVTAPSPF